MSQREKITFEERVQVQIDRDEAKPMPSRTGETEYMRVCDGDTRIMFAPAALEAAIKESGAKAGDIIQIDKVTRGRTTQWEVAICSQITHPPAPTTRRATAPAATAAPRQAHRPQPAAEMAMGVSEADIPQRGAERQTAIHAARMASAFRAAILATGEAEQHAAAIGIRSLNLSDRETVIRVALSIYIAMEKEAR